MNYETRFGLQADSVEYRGDDAEAAPKQRNWLMWLVALAVIGIFVAAHFLMTSSGGSSAPAGAAKQAPTVSVVVPGRQLVASEITVNGALAARREMPVGAVGEGGMVTRVFVEPGSWVKQGQILAIVDRQVQNQQASQLAAQITAAQAEARLAQAELDRAQALQSRGFISQADLQRKTATRDGANARVRVAQAQFGEARARMGRLDIRSPASGLVLTRAVEPGQVVGGGSGVLFRIALGGEMEMKAKMSEVDLAKMSQGLTVQVVPVGGTQSFTGRVWQISPVIDPQSRLGEARIALPWSPALRPGGFASARIASGQVEAPLLAESAVQSDAKGNFVYVVNPANKIERRDVKVGTIGEKGMTIIAGLQGNEKVVISAGGFVNPGDTVVPNLIKSKA